MDAQVRLAELLVRQDFGDPAQQVVGLMLRHGRLTFPELHKMLEERHKVRANEGELKALLAHLIMHRVVEAEEKQFLSASRRGHSEEVKRARMVDEQVSKACSAGPSTTSRILAEYACNLDAVLRRIRYPRYVEMVHLAYEEKIPGASYVLQAILYHGLCSAEELEDRTARMLVAGENPVPVSSAVRALWELGLLVPVQPVPLYIVKSLGKNDVPRVSRKTMQTRILDEQRGKLVRPSESRSSELDSKRVVDVAFDKLQALGRTQAIAAAVGERYPTMQPFGRVLMLKVLESVSSDRPTAHLDTVRMAKEMVQSLSETQRQTLSAKSSEEGPVRTLQNFLELLQGDKFARFASQGGTAFQVDLGEMVAALQMQLVEACIRESFGVRSLRIFRVLVQDKFLEFKVISDLALIDLKETKQRLFSLYREGYVQVMEISKTQERSSAKSSFLWTVRFPDTLRSVMARAWKIMYNLQQKLEQLEALADSKPDVAAALSSVHATIVECDATLETLGDDLSPFYRANNPLSSHSSAGVPSGRLIGEDYDDDDPIANVYDDDDDDDDEKFNLDDDFEDSRKSPRRRKR